MDSRVVRTEEQIKKVEEDAIKWTEKHPRTIFGDDNEHSLRIFQKIIEKVRRGESIDELEDFIDDAYEDRDQSTAIGVLDWLLGDSDDPPYSYDEEGEQNEKG